MKVLRSRTMRLSMAVLLGIMMVITLIPTVAFANPAEEPAAQDQVQELASQENITEETPVTPEPVVPDQWYKDPTTGYWMYYKNGTYLTGKHVISGKTYYFKDNGHMRTGWVKYPNGYKHFFETKGSDPTTSSLGQMLEGWLNYGGNKYYLNPGSGVMRTGLVKVGDDRYFMSEKSGKMQTSCWRTVEGRKYYFNEKGKALKSGKRKVDGYYYYFSDAGVLKTGFITINNKKYYFDPARSGRMAIGWKTINNRRYYFSSSGAAYTGLKSISGSHYYFSTDGVMKTGNIKIGSSLYYFYSSGKAQWSKGWFTGSDRKKRYCMGSGKLATGTKKIGSIWYEFSTSTGQAIRTIGDDIDKKIQPYDGYYKGYLVYIKRSSHQLRVYKGYDHHWSRVKTWKCSVGRPSQPTPAGKFTITKHIESYQYVSSGNKVVYWYHTEFTSNDGIHSGLYYADTGNPGTPYDTRLDVDSSQGSVRVDYSNAKWLYFTVPTGARVIIE